jgi:hypothetical protein
MWHEDWINGTYSPSVKIMKRVRNKYTDITVEVLCKVHARNPKAKLLKEGRDISAATGEEQNELREVRNRDILLPSADYEVVAEGLKITFCPQTLGRAIIDN